MESLVFNRSVAEGASAGPVAVVGYWLVVGFFFFLFPPQFPRKSPMIYTKLNRGSSVEGSRKKAKEDFGFILSELYLFYHEDFHILLI